MEFPEQSECPKWGKDTELWKRTHLEDKARARHSNLPDGHAQGSDHPWPSQPLKSFLEIILQKHSYICLPPKHGSTLGCEVQTGNQWCGTGNSCLELGLNTTLLNVKPRICQRPSRSRADSNYGCVKTGPAKSRCSRSTH